MKRFMKKTLSDQVYETLENKIVSGEYQTGEIITEMHLVETMNISRTPVREALHRLEQEHLVKMTEHGMVVRGILKEDLADIILIRSHIEGSVCRFAAENHTQENLEKLKSIICEQQEALERSNPDDIKICDDEFHRQICEMCGHPLLADTILPLHRKMSRYRRNSMSSATRAAEVVAEHCRIYEAIASGDGEKSEELAILHLRNAANSILGKEGLELCQ